MQFVLLVYWIVLYALVLLAASGVLTWLWNITIPELFGLKALRYLQALRLLLISALLFGPGLILHTPGGPFT